MPDTLRTTVDEGLGNALQTIQANISQYIQTALGFIVTRLLQVVSLISFIVGLLVIPIWLFYLLNDQRKARIGLNRVLNFRIRPDFWNVWGIVDGSLSAYIRGQVTLGTIIGVSVGVGLAIIDLIPGLEIDYILLLALWAGICELIPMIGAILGGRAYWDRGLNSNADLRLGKLRIEFDAEETPPLEDLTFGSRRNEAYFDNLATDIQRRISVEFGGNLSDYISA